MQKAMGKLPTMSGLPPFAIHYTDSLKEPTYTRYTIRFTVAENEVLPAYLYVPVQKAPGKKLPAMLSLHGTNDLGKGVVDGQGDKPNRANAKELAQRGYVVIAPDYPSFGDLKDYDFDHDRYESGTMKGIFDHMRCVDLLQSLDYVDPERIGVIGLSLGGHNAMFVGAFDPRIKVVVSSSGWTEMDYYNVEASTKRFGGRLGAWAQKRYMPLLRDKYKLDPKKVPFDFDEIIAAIAPRAFFSVSPVGDLNFDVKGVKAGIAKAEKVYAALGAKDMLQVRYPEGGHDFPVESRKQAYAFIDSLFAFTPNDVDIALRTYGGHYSQQRIANVRNNCKKYDWAKKQLENVVAKAKPWLAKEDEELWKMVPGQDLPRTIDVTYDAFSSGPKFLGCLVCGENIFKYGNYPYNPDFENKPWKLTCPYCHSVFPTNDFGKFYESAIDEHGLFDPKKGDTSLLFNTAHPDPNDPLHKYGVDNGFGYVAANGRAYKYIGYYSWKYWEYIMGGLRSLADAFLFTGDQRYSHKAAILLDRIADVYPDMDWKPYADRGWYHSDGGSKLGKIEGSIWETGVAQTFADAYDKIISGTLNDAALYSFLNAKSHQYKLPTEKGTRALFLFNVDERILKTAFAAVLSRQIRGNQGMHQLTVASCALALNTNPETKKWLDWLFEPAGGAIPGLMLNHFDRDGTSDEGAPGYAFIWAHQVTKIAELLSNYPNYSAHNICRDFPQFRAAFTVAYRMAALGVAIPNIGDNGSTGLVTTYQADPNFMATGYKYTRDPKIAVAAYRANGNAAKGLGFDIFSNEPESVHQEIQRLGEKAGPRPVGGYLMSGFGLALLEAANGTRHIALANNYGRTKMHAHPDLLNFDLFAFGHWLAPDHGYPEFATNIPSNTEWTGSTISHNTVFVDKHPQKMVWGGYSRLFTQLKGLGAVELDGQKAYPDLQDYSRTMLLMGGNNTNADSNAYVVDIFRVKGGYDHVYSFHGPPGMIADDGLQLKPQIKGTYAGENIPKGTKAKNFPDGYSFLYNVRKDEQPPSSFTLDWKAENGYRGITDQDDIHLRMHALTPCQDVALADGDPPQNKPGNPKHLGYVLMHRKGTDLQSTFVAVFEPYRSRPFIKAVTRVDNGNNEQVALKVEKMDGHTDYILYNPSSKQLLHLPNGIAMDGTVGYLQEKKGRVEKPILVNGTALRYKNAALQSTGPITGKVVKMDREPDDKGWLLVESNLPIDKTVIGEQIMIETTSERDASYTIHDVQQQGALTKIFCGPVTFVSGFKGGDMVVRTATVPRTYSEGYTYDFEEGAPFTIATHAMLGK
jgi:dienelactone hydrolase